jgi:autotransporter family porin
MGLVNSGTIIANQGTPLIINPSSSSGGFTNNGTLTVSTGDTLHVSNASGGAFTNFLGGTLTGGTYNVSGTLEIDQLGSTGGEIVNSAATIILNGTGSSFVDAAGMNALTNLAANSTTTSGFTVTDGRNFTTVGNFTNSGTLTVAVGASLM